MELYTATQIQEWDAYTIAHEPIASIDLMERASSACLDWLMENGYEGKSFALFCGKGNNGGDGLALARMLAQRGFPVQVFILEFGHLGTADFQQNLARLHDTTATISFISSEEHLHPLLPGQIIIDALLGSGLNRPLEGLTASLVVHLNESGHPIIAIDLPTGLYADKTQEGGVIIRASVTLTFQIPKISFLFAENAAYTGTVHVLDIGLHPEFIRLHQGVATMTDEKMIRSILQPRKKHSHKGTYGTGAIIAGSKGMMGAAVLCSRAMLRAGAGKITCHIPLGGNQIVQIAVPEAMTSTDKEQDYISDIPAIEHYNAIAVGPGIGQYPGHHKWLEKLFIGYTSPLVIDADALNTLAANQELLPQIPEGSVLTPHPGEFKKLFGSSDSFQSWQKAQEQSRSLKLVIVLKGAYTLITGPDGRTYFNSTGNPGMATAGSGDVLTGIIAGLLCQGYTPVEAAIAGVFLHGRAGDLAIKNTSQPSLIASDIIDHLGKAFLSLSTSPT